MPREVILTRHSFHFMRNDAMYLLAELPVIVSVKAEGG